MNSQDSINRLTEYVIIQVELYQQLLEAGKTINQLIKNEAYNELEKKVVEKEEIIKAIDLHQNDFKDNLNPILTDLGLQRKNWLTDILKKENIPDCLKKNIEKSFNLLNSIKKLDDENLRILKEQKSQLNNDFYKIKNGKKINNNYNKRVKLYSSFIDKKG